VGIGHVGELTAEWTQSEARSDGGQRESRVLERVLNVDELVMLKCITAQLNSQNGANASDGAQGETRTLNA
jgi:hypothetical protein